MDRIAVLIVAASGRALAASARRGGFSPLVADFFADQDTVALAQACRRLETGLHAGMQGGEVLDALAALADGCHPLGVVCGTGFEDRTGLLAQIATRWRLLGSAPEVVARVKNPLALATLCRDRSIPHPEIVLRPPADAGGWLAKRHGGAGGGHVRLPPDGDRADGIYFQRRVPGMPVSALILAHGGRARVLGFSAQWAAPTPRQPFRYGGAVTPAPIAPKTADVLCKIIQRLVAVVPLAGLNSVDFLVVDDAVWLLEINPRPGATLDIFEPDGGSLFSFHVQACGGVLPERVAPRLGAAASAIVYADHDIPAVPALHWPDWAADRPQPGICIKAGEPLCTVTAAAPTADEAKRIVGLRIATILAGICEKAA
jgi:predicted ATP-grasp superfamily ATP-dependent carboligase